MSFGVSGLMSGLDTESIISQMMQLERRPIAQLQRQEASYQTKISGIGAMKNVLAELQNAASALKETDLFDSFSVKSANTDILTASASDTAVAGTYSVEVTQLAEAQSIKSSSFFEIDPDVDVVGTGTLSIQLGTNTAVEVTIDADHNTLSGIATAINDSDAEVTAGVLNDGAGNFYLTLTGKDTGAANTITFAVTADGDSVLDDAAGLSNLYVDPGAGTMTEDNVALDAELTVNNNPVSRASNSIDDLIQGVTLDLEKAEVGTQFDVTVSRNVTSVTTKISDFVTKYNSALNGLQSLQAFNPDTGEVGLLQGDSTPRLAQSQLQNLLRTTVDGVASEFDTLAELGVTAGEDGQLSFDSAVFTTAYESNRTDIVNFLTQTTAGSEGFALQFENFLDGYVDSSTGLLSSKEDSLNSSIDRIGDQVEKIEFRLSKREANLRRQFESLESLLAQFQTTSGVLTQQLSSLSNLNNQISKL